MRSAISSSVHLAQADGFEPRAGEAFFVVVGSGGAAVAI
jgi:hypothetical protein